MKKLKRVFGSVANLASGGSDEQSSSGTPRSCDATSAHRSMSTSPHGSGPQKSSYYSYETRSLDSFTSGTSAGITQVDPHSKHDKNFTKLHKWAYLGDITKLKKFIKKVPVDAQDSEGKTALHHASSQGHADALLFLLGSKSNVEVKDNAGMTPFLRAVERSQLHIVQMLLQRRVDMKVSDYQRNNCLHLAARTGATELLTVLLDCGSDCDAPNALGHTPLHIACSENQEEAVESLLRHGASVNVSDKEGVTPLMLVAKMGSVPLVESLIDHGADVSPLDASKWSAADYARFTNHNQLYNHLKALMQEDGSSCLVPQGLLNVSDDGSDQDIAATGPPSENNQSNFDREDNSWSDSSDVDSVKEKPKLNLTKFLLSSNESSGKVFASATHEGNSSQVSGPPKPPRLHTSSSSIASEVDAKASDVCSDKDDSLKGDDSWKSSSEEEDEPKSKLKSFALFTRDLNSREEIFKKREMQEKIGHVVSHSRTSREDLLAELGLNDMAYQSSEDDVSFDDEKPVLPLEGTPKKIVISHKNSMSSEDDNINLTPSKTLPHLSISQSADGVSPRKKHQSPKPTQEQPVELIKINSSAFSSPENSDGKSRKTSISRESPRKSPMKRSPRKLKRSSNFDSDSDDELTSPQRPQRRKNHTPTKGKLEQQLTETLASDQVNLGSEEENKKFKSVCNEASAICAKDSNSDSALMLSLEEKQTSDHIETIENINKDGKSSETDRNNIGGGSVPFLSTNTSSSCTNTLPTIIGTLGRVGTMQETEELWEANASISLSKHSGSGSRSPNSDDEQPKDFIGKSGKVIDNLDLQMTAHETDNNRINETKNGSLRKNAKVEDTSHIISNDILEGKSVIAESPRSSVSLNAVLTSLELSSAKEKGNLEIVKEKLPIASSDLLYCRENQMNSASSIEKLSQNSINKKNKMDKNKLAPNQNAENSKLLHKNTVTDAANGACNQAALSTTHHKTGSGSGRCSMALSDEDSNIQDLVSIHGLDELDDGISAASTETEESTHINSGLKNSLLTPLSSLPDAHDVAQLQDFVRELRLKLEKEFGRRAALETRVSNLQQQEKELKLFSEEQELELQRQQREISTLTGRIKQFEYQSKCEQDSSRLKEQSLEDSQQRCAQLEEHCNTLREHDQQQEQLVNSLMLQLQTKECLNQNLQGMLEELTSQTKYVSMKSCQTEDIYLSAEPHITTSVQTNMILGDTKQSVTQTDPSLTSADVMVQTENNTENSAAELQESGSSLSRECASASKIKTVTTSAQTQQSLNSVSNILCTTNSVSAQVQCIPETLIKSSQTQMDTQTQYTQTETADLHVCSEKKIIDSSSQTSTLIRQTAVQTDTVDSHCDSESFPQIQDVQVQLIASAVQPMLQNFSHDIESLVMEKNELSQTSVLEMIRTIIISQIDKLQSSINSSLQQTSSVHNEGIQHQLSEEISHLKPMLQNQLDTITKIYDDVAEIKSNYLKDVITEVNSDIESRLKALMNTIEGLQQSQGSSGQVMLEIASTLKEFKQNNEQILKCISNCFQENRDFSSHEYNEIKHHFETQINEVKKALELSKQSDDSGVSESLTRGILEKLETLYNSFTQSVEKSCTVENIYGVQDGIKKMSENIQKKLFELEQGLQTVNSDTRLDQSVLDELMNSIKDSNNQLAGLLMSKTSEANSNISEALEENFHIIQDHLQRLQQTLLKRINEVSEHVNVSEDQKVVWLSKQVMEMASQVSGMKSGLLRVQSSLEASQSLPSSAGILDEALVSSLKASNDQVVSTINFQNQGIIQQLEALQKEIHSTVVQGQISKVKEEVNLLKEALNNKENELEKLAIIKENLQEKLQQQNIKLESLKCKEDEQILKIESLNEKLHYFEEILKEKDEKIQQAAAKNANQNEDTTKIRQENFRLSSENTKLSSLLEAEQRHHQWCEGELQSLKNAKEIAEAKTQEMLAHLQQASLQRTPPTGRDDDDDDSVRYRKQEMKKLELEKQEAENCYSEQYNLAHRLELQLKEEEIALRLEKIKNEELEKHLKKTKDSLNALQQDLSEARQNQETIQELENHIKESEIEIKSRDVAVETLKKKLEAANKEKLDLKQDIMLLKSEKLTYELVRQEKELAEQMQKKTEEQLHQLQRKIPLEYVSKASLQIYQKEIESKYQLELSAKLAELNQLIEEQNKQQESQAKTRRSCEQGLQSELSKKSEEIIRLRAKLSTLDEKEDTWKIRHDRLMALFQHQAETNHNHVHRLPQTQKLHEDSLSVSLQEIDNHLKTPFATSTFLGQLTPPSSLQLPKAPSNIDSYHYTHSDSLECALHKYLSTVDKPRSLLADDKPQARISPMQPSVHSLKHDRLPSLDQSCESYVDLLKKKYGF
ncbi:uveal autoantigen with coiled-coil domains and ankyrin repeats isoform X2 [Cherax quadricarinatus]|uniref:uveal autoantigen with coiled-coil domains and ankyrin repeats isoform X2 n=1 Tax=Cherax quadricarinatus TaxID=27406 RepID=UPI0023799C58|nr:ankyrin repeat domain-containing protein 26-like isoform X2 [Cherax quadricarinatus]